MKCARTHPSDHRVQEHLFISSSFAHNTLAFHNFDEQLKHLLVKFRGTAPRHQLRKPQKYPPGFDHHPSLYARPPLPAAKMMGLANMQPRQLATQLLNFALVLSTAFMLWKGLSVVSDSPSPIVVVLSGSMEPAFERGDLLFLWNRGLDTQVGEIVVYNVKGKDIPIVHRVVRRFGGG